MPNIEFEHHEQVDYKVQNIVRNLFEGLEKNYGFFSIKHVFNIDVDKLVDFLVGGYLWPFKEGQDWEEPRIEQQIFNIREFFIIRDSILAIKNIIKKYDENGDFFYTELRHFLASEKAFLDIYKSDDFKTKPMEYFTQKYKDLRTKEWEVRKREQDLDSVKYQLEQDNKKLTAREKAIEEKEANIDYETEKEGKIRILNKKLESVILAIRNKEDLNKFVD
jgi:hypothetical protein